MGSHLDIIGSFILAGLLMVSFAVFMGDRQAGELEANNQVMAQTSMSDVSSLMLFDIRKAGYRVPVGTNPFKICEPNRLSFLGDIDNNGTVDTVTYRFATPVTTTPNPADSLLYRTVNGASDNGIDMGLTGLNFRYYTVGDSLTTDIAKVKRLTVEFRVQSRFPVNDEYQETYSYVRISPRNRK